MLQDHVQPTAQQSQHIFAVTADASMRCTARRDAYIMASGSMIILSNDYCSTVLPAPALYSLNRMSCCICMLPAHKQIGGTTEQEERCKISVHMNVKCQELIRRHERSLTLGCAHLARKCTEQYFS